MPVGQRPNSDLHEARTNLDPAVGLSAKYNTDPGLCDPLVMSCVQEKLSSQELIKQFQSHELPTRHFQTFWESWSTLAEQLGWTTAGACLES